MRIYPQTSTKLRVYVLDDGNSSAMRAMTEILCIEGLQSPMLQQEADRIDADRSHLVARLEQLENLAPDIQAAEQFLQTAEGTNSVDQTMMFLQRLQQFVLWQPPHQSISDRINKERRAIQEAISQKEDELSELARFRYIARSKPKDRPHHAKAGNLNHAIFSGETSGEFILFTKLLTGLSPRQPN